MPLRDPNTPVETVHVEIPGQDGPVSANLEVSDGYALFEGDIMIDVHQGLPYKRAAGKASWTYKWSGGVVPFEISDWVSNLSISLRAPGSPSPSPLPVE